MAKIQMKTHHDQSKRKNSSSSPFLCCFGFSRKDNYFPEKESEKDIIMISPSDHDHHDGYQKKKLVVRFSCWSRLRLKSPSGVKTVPVLDTTVPEKPQKDQGKIYRSSKPKSKSKPNPKPEKKLPSKRQGPPTTNSQLPNEIEIVVSAPPDPGAKPKPLQIKYSSAQNTNLENRKNSSPLHSSKDDACNIQKRLSFSRKIESIRAGSSQRGSPVQAKLKPARTIRHSNSFTAGPNRDKSQVTEPTFSRRFEPVVGMSIVMVTLVMMVLWGRLCAILCTSAWLYFLPRLSSAVDSGGVILGRARGLDLGSEENKKKAVFEGFLERDTHRINS